MAIMKWRTGQKHLGLLPILRFLVSFSDALYRKALFLTVTTIAERVINANKTQIIRNLQGREANIPINGCTCFLDGLSLKNHFG